jgi:hypothetical protein
VTCPADALEKGDCVPAGGAQEKPVVQTGKALREHRKRGGEGRKISESQEVFVE